MGKSKVKPWRIEYLTVAQQDLIEIFEYIRTDNPAAAREFVDLIDARIGQLALFPRLGTVPKDGRLRALGYRVLVIGQFLVFYVINGTSIEIRRVLHGHRKYDFLL